MSSNTIHDVPLQVQFPVPSVKDEVSSATPTADGEFVRAVLKYRNDDGRDAILALAKTVYHDFGPYNHSLAVSISPSDLEGIKSNSNVDCFEGDGKVIYCSIR